MPALKLRRKRTRIFIIEDNRLLREGISSILKSEPGITVVPIPGSNEKIPPRIRSSKPHVVLLDLSLRSQDSLELVRLIRRDFPDVNVIGMDLVPLQPDTIAFVEAGVAGFILKDASTADFLKTIRSVAQGEKILPPSLTDSLFSQIIAHAATKEKESTLIKAVRMTKRERQIIELVAKGLTNKEIAKIIRVSAYTVKSHIHNILEKLALHSRIQIATQAATINSLSDLTEATSLLDQ